MNQWALMETFDGFSEAFAYCRELDKPVAIEISGHGEFKLYPSGKAVRLTKQLPQEAHDLQQKCAVRWRKKAGWGCPCVYRYTDGCPLFCFEQNRCRFSADPETAAFYA